MPTRSIDRIRMLDVDHFTAEYIRKLRPVVITDLFAQDEIKELNTIEFAKKHIGSTKLRVQTEYTSPTTVRIAEEMTFNKYWEIVEAHPELDLLCTEYEIPARIMAMFHLPEVCRVTSPNVQEVFDLPRKFGDHDLALNLFIANRGNRAHLHWDGDQRHVLLHQVFGCKEVILFPPDSGIHLKIADPVRATPGFSGLDIERMSAQEKNALVDRANGYQTTILPGETIFIPALMWHYLEYVDDGMSFNIRFGRGATGRAFCVDMLHRDHYIQNASYALAGERVLDLSNAEVVKSVAEQYTKPLSRRLDQVVEMRTLFKRLCRRLCPEAKADECCSVEGEELELQKILKDIEHRVCYSDPSTLRRMRLVGPASSSQQRHIRENSLVCGHPPNVLERLLQNRVGKKRTSELNKAEAAIFLGYLSSPGAIW